MHRSEFIKLVKEQFPELREPINREEGLLHFEMSVLRRRAQRAIFDGERETLSVIFALTEKGYVEGNPALKNAIDVSFVEDLDFITEDHFYEWAWKLLPETLKELFTGFHHEMAWNPDLYALRYGTLEKNKKPGFRVTSR